MQTQGLLLRKRIGALFFVFTVMFCLLGGRVFWVQFVKGAELADMAVQNRTRDVAVEAKRGAIYDRHGRELAISISVDSVYANPAEVAKAHKEAESAQKLATVLGMDEQNLLKTLSSGSSYEWIKRQITPEQAQQIKGLKLKGIYLTPEYRRFYPKGTLASHVLGIAGTDNVGLEGIDYYYNDLVGGTKGRIIIERDAAGRDIPEATHKYIPPVNGGNLVLTIDETIQHSVERELDKIVQEQQPKAAAAIVMDPHTGEILALASRPTFDPNNYNATPASNRRNFAINDSYEPGSTMKTITAAMALEENIVNRNTYFNCTGSVQVGKNTISCLNHKAHGAQTFAQIFENSCNVGFVRVGLELGMNKYYQYLSAFGFGQLTGIDLPGEATGILVPKQSARQIDLATMAFGQANAVTPIQLTAAISAIANGGKLMQPHLLKEVLDSEGQVTRTTEAVMVKQVISEDAARELCDIMQGEVTDGTGKNAYIEGYNVGGKTGTAQKIAPGGGYLADEYVASFVGVAPCDDPQIVCLVVVDAPQGWPHFGGTVAAPAAREIINDSLRYLGIPLRNQHQDKSAALRGQVIVPDVINRSASEASTLLKKRGFQVQVNGSGDRVWLQSPLAESKQAKGSVVSINLASKRQTGAGAEVTLPDLRGKTMKESAQILGDLGLKMTPAGYGIAFEQSPQAGRVIVCGSTVKVGFRALSP